MIVVLEQLLGALLQLTNFLDLPSLILESGQHQLLCSMLIFFRRSQLYFSRQRLLLNSAIIMIMIALALCIMFCLRLVHVLILNRVVHLCKACCVNPLNLRINVAEGDALASSVGARPHVRMIAPMIAILLKSSYIALCGAMARGQAD